MTPLPEPTSRKVEKPLHVQVAHATGCVGPFWQAGEDDHLYAGHWICGCSRHNSDARHVPRYDTDWSATGPLIEKYGISLDYFNCDPGCCPPEGHSWTAAWGGLGIEFATEKKERKAPLLAVCSLLIDLGKAGKL